MNVVLFGQYMLLFSWCISQHDANHGGVSPKVKDSRTEYRALLINVGLF